MHAIIPWSPLTPFLPGSPFSPTGPRYPVSPTWVSAHKLTVYMWRKGTFHTQFFYITTPNLCTCMTEYHVLSIFIYRIFNAYMHNLSSVSKNHIIIVPINPLGPLSPESPLGPVSPLSPLGPLSPFVPSPLGPFSPVSP